MAAHNGIQFSLDALDNITPMLNAVRSLARDTQRMLNNIKAPQENHAPKTEHGTGAMLAFGAAAGVAAMAVSNLGSNLTSAVTEGMKFQTMSKAVASDIQMNLGGTMVENQKMLTDMQKQLAKDAAALPGETKDYNTVLNAISQGVSKADMGDKASFKTDALDIAKRTTILSSLKGSDAGQAGSAMNMAINGSRGLGELFSNDIFEKNATLKFGITDKLAEMGLQQDDWKQLNIKQRKDILKAALEKSTPDSLIKEFEGTTESLWQGIVSSISDPLTGAMGVLRDVSSRNNRNVMGAVFDALKAFNQMASGVNDLLTALGLAFDPMAVIIDAIDFVVGIFNNISYMLERGKEKAGGLATFNLSDVAVSITSWINQYIQQIASSLAVVNFGTVSNILWSGILGLVNAVTTYISTFDYTSLGAIVGEALGAIFLFVLDINNWIRFIGSIWSMQQAIGDALAGFAWGLVKGLVNSIIIKPVKSMAEAFTKAVSDLFELLMLPFKSVTEAVVNFINGAKGLLNIPGNVVQGIVNAPGNALSAVADGANQWLKDTLGLGADPTTPPTNKPQAGNTLTDIMPVLPQTGIRPLVPAPVAVPVAGISFAPNTTINVADGSQPHPDLLNTIKEQLASQYNEYKSRQLGTGLA